ncbi:MAG: PHP domain-containing protein [Candidatus Thorarchaeota archaeon]
MKALVDLHTHSDRSDGLHSPQELVELAEEIGLEGIALTDHDTLDGLREFMETQISTDLQLVPGVEISTEYQGSELHMLGYFVPLGESPLDVRLRKTRESRHTRFPKMVQKLRDLGIEIEVEEIQKMLKDVDSPGRPHLARILIEKGIVEDINEAFAKYLASGKSAYVGRQKMDSFYAINLIRESGAVPVLAHPLLIKEIYLKQLLHQLKSHGLEGVEVDYGYRKPENMDQVESVRKIAKDLGLIATGGSDFHGDDGHNSLGSVGTNLETIDLLRKSCEQIRGSSCKKL